MAEKTCPHCGAPVKAHQLVCPHCHTVLKKKNPLVPYVITGVLVFLIAVVASVILTSPAPAPTVPAAATVTPASSGTAAAAGPTQPACTVAIAGSQVGTSIRLQVMTNSCSAGEIVSLAVTVNGEDVGTLDSVTGSSRTFAGTAGADAVSVTAKYANGAEKIVYQNAAL